MSRIIRCAIVISLTVTVGCSLTASSQRAMQGERHWDHLRGRVKLRFAQQQYDAGLLEDTVRTVTESIALDPTQVEAYVLLAKAQLECAKPASARETLEAATRAGLESADLHYMKGVILEQRVRFEGALAEYARARAIDAGSIDYLIAEVECLVALNRTDEASALLVENAGRFDNDAAVAVLAGHVAALRGDTEAALRHYGRAAAALPDSALIGEALGLLLAKAKRFDAAIAALRPLIEPPIEGYERGTIRRTLAACHLRRGDPAAAKRVLAEYARAHPDDAFAQLLVAKAAIATGDDVTALRAVDLARRHRPNHPEVLLVQATTQWRRGALEAAASTLYRLLTQRPEDVDAYCLLAEVFRAQSQPDDARAAYRKALEIDPQCAWALAGLSALRRLNSSEQSLYGRV